MNRSRLLLCAAALVAAACQDRQSPTAAPFYLIQDAAHNGGNPHFYWLPPMTRQPSFTGTFDGTLAIKARVELGAVTFAVTGMRPRAVRVGTVAKRWSRRSPGGT